MDEDFAFKKRPQSANYRESDTMDDEGKLQRPISPQYRKKHTNLIIRQKKYPAPGDYDKRDGMHMIQWLDSYNWFRH